MNKASTNQSALNRKLYLRNIERGRHHLIVKQMVRTESGPRKLPKLYVLAPIADGGIELRAFEPLLEYFEERSGMSYDWKRNTSRAIGLLIDFSMAMSGTHRFKEWAEEGKLQRRLYRGLAIALVRGTGTMGPDGRIQDPCGLHWWPLGKGQAGVLLRSLSLFFKWMAEDDANSSWAVAASTEKIGEHPVVALRLAAELQLRTQAALLGHLKGVQKDPSHPFPFIVGTPPKFEGAVPTFPARHVISFLRHGFADRWGNRNEAAELLAHLAFGLGVRESEPLHLFVTDIQFVAGVPWVFFHHPSEGKVSDGQGGLVTRRQYLQRFGLLPRCDDQGRNKSGWKGMSDDVYGTPGFWLPIDSIRNRAAELLKRYIFVTRPAIMAARPRSLGDHPFLFVNPRNVRGRNTGEIGDPYTIEAYEGAWESAVRRVGRLSGDPVMDRMEKNRGNTPHGARHFFGKFLFSSGVEGSVIKRCMHHKTLAAHLAYTRLTPAEINDILHKASRGDCVDAPFKDLRNDFMSQFENIPQAG
jgi:hypothetical protein